MILDPRELTPSALYRWMITIVVPRPIAFVSTAAPGGRANLAPFSYFNAISSDPPLVGLSFTNRTGDPKDTLRNIRDTGEFVVNVVSEELLEPMARTAGEWPSEVSEFEVAGLEAAPSLRVRAPSVAASPIQLECRLHREMPLGNATFVVGEVLLVRIRDEVITDERVDPMKLRPVGRLGGELYSLTREIARAPRPRVERRGPGGPPAISGS